MKDERVRETSESVITAMSESEEAERLRSKGIKVVYHNGHYWKSRNLFFQPVNLLSQFAAKMITKPALMCWGYSAALCCNDTKAANGSIPIHLLSDLDGYEKKLRNNRKYELRKCRRHVKVVEVVDTGLLQDCGYEVVVSSLKRTKHRKIPSPASYLTYMARLTTTGKPLILAAFIGSTMGGFSINYAIEDITYGGQLFVRTDALSSHIVIGLIAELVDICKRCGIRLVSIGQPIPEDPHLGYYKESIGFPVQNIPAKIAINPLLGHVVRRFQPYAYYRLTGL